jgi:hypothetical protein
MNTEEYNLRNLYCHKMKAKTGWRDKERDLESSSLLK